MLCSNCNKPFPFLSWSALVTSVLTYLKVYWPKFLIHFNNKGGLTVFFYLLFSLQDICYSQNVFCRHMLFQKAIAVFHIHLGNILDVIYYLKHGLILDWCSSAFGFFWWQLAVSSLLSFTGQLSIITSSNGFVLFIRHTTYLLLLCFHVRVDWIRRVFSWLSFKIVLWLFEC